MFSKEDGLVAASGGQMGTGVLPLTVTPSRLGALPEAGH